MLGRSKISITLGLLRRRRLIAYRREALNLLGLGGPKSNYLIYVRAVTKV